MTDRVDVEEVDEVAPRRIRLGTVDDVRVEMARVYREMRNNTLDAAAGTKFIWVLATIAKVTEASTFERRLQAIEDAQRRIGNDTQSPGSMEQLEQQVATIDQPRADEIALRERIIDAEIRATLALERLASRPVIGTRTAGGRVVDGRAGMRESVADGSRRVAEMFKELRPLVALSGEAWIAYMQGMVARAAEKHRRGGGPG